MERLRVVVSGMLAANPGHGGATWTVMQWVLGLRDLGHDVLVLEPIAREQILPAGAPLPRSANGAYFASLMERLGLPADRASLLDPGSGESVGADRAQVEGFVESADVLLNLAGTLRLDALTERIPVRAYLDLDPGFTHVWQSAGGIDMGLDAHTHFFTVGTGVGRPGCPVPTCGREWTPFLPPVHLPSWPPASDHPVEPALTTVANWRSYGSMTHEGIHYGQKAHSVRALMELPLHVWVPCRLALGIHPDEEEDLARLRASGWELEDPDRAAGTPGRYQRFVSRSWAEIGIAKSGYVAARTGWFSDRAACYLASGRPVVAQDTGFGAALPTGAGLLTFTTLEGCVAATDALLAGYDEHRRAAREIAEEHLATSVVIPRVLEEAGRRRLGVAP